MPAFYLKYRPQKISDLDLTSVRERLSKIVKSKNIPHAFLFSGPKGTGKTSTARILAKVVNCESPQKNGEPCGKCDSCVAITKGMSIDVIEIDAASHRGIDDIRELRDAIKLSPAHSKKKVYIIDEAHMLTKEASNALLKTLEEPPDHAIFILATTNPEKLIATIHSRCTNVVFKKASIDEIVASLEKKIAKEKIKIDKPALRMIAKYADGSFRDADKILEQFIYEDEKITSQMVEEALSLETKGIDEFISLLVKKEAEKLIKMAEDIHASGSIEHFIKEVVKRLQEALLVKYGLAGKGIKELTQEDLVYLTKIFSLAIAQMPDYFLEQVPIEIAIIDWCEKKDGANSESDQRLPTGKKINAKEELQTRVGKKKDSQISASTKKKDKEENISLDSSPINGQPIVQDLQDFKTSQADCEMDITDEMWRKILGELRPDNASTEALLRAAKPLDYDGNRLTLGVFYNFHKEKLEGHPHINLVEKVVEKVIGSPVRIKCLLTEPPQEQVAKTDEVVLTEVDNKQEKKKTETLTNGEDEDIINSAKEIFGI